MKALLRRSYSFLSITLPCEPFLLLIEEGDSFLSSFNLFSYLFISISNRTFLVNVISQEIPVEFDITINPRPLADIVTEFGGVSKSISCFWIVDKTL